MQPAMKSLRLMFVFMFMLMAAGVPGVGRSIGVARAQEVCRVTTGQLDVMFLIDQTGSMGGVIETAKREALAIAAALRGLVPNTAFGVASFADYPISGYGGVHDVPYTLQSPISTNLDHLTAGVAKVSLMFGGDVPEAYSRAIVEMADLESWRAGSRRIVVLIGDATPHGLDEGFGNGQVDPGRDGIVGTADDIRTFADAVARAVDANVTIIGLSTGSSARAAAAFQFAASATGGTYGEISASGSIAKPIADLVGGVVCTDNRPVKRLPADVWGGLLAEPNLQVVRGQLVIYNLHVRNWGEGHADWVMIQIPFDPTRLQIVDAQFSRDDMWVSELPTNQVVIKLGRLIRFASATGVVRFRVLANASAEPINLQPVVSWGDGGASEERYARHRANMSSVMIGDRAVSGEAALAVATTGEQITITGEGYAPGEFIDTWYNIGDRDIGTVRVVADNDGKIRIVVNRADLPAASGAYRLVARGVYSHVTRVATFTGR
jgi:hypothetical protein